MAVLRMVCVCVMSHHNGSIVALSFLMLTDHTAIFRFYKPFSKELQGESSSVYSVLVCERERVCVCVCAYLSDRAAEKSPLSSSGLWYLSKLLSATQKNSAVLLKGRLVVKVKLLLKLSVK